MNQRFKTPGFWLFSFIILETLIAVAWILQRQVRSPNIGKVEQGRLVAERMGCFGCHGVGGTGGISNPGTGDEGSWLDREDADDVCA